MNIDRLKTVMHYYNNDNIQNLSKDEETQYIYGLLLEKNIIDIKSNGKIFKKNKNSIHYGRLRINKKYGFVTTDKGDFFIPNVGDYVDGDEVVLIHVNNIKSEKNDEGLILGYVKRELKQTIIRINKRLKCVALEGNVLEKYKFKITDENIIKYANTYVKVNINNVSNYEIEASVVEVVADKNDPDLQMKLVLSNYNIESEFTKQQLDEARIIANKKIQTDDVKRIDLRDLITFTIDGADAKDLDDAVSFIKEGDKYRLYVSIADVSHYIKEDSILDKSAFSRSTSVYFIDRVVPMLPKDISNGICSLHPNVNRYTLTCEMLINNLGFVEDSKIYPSLINSRYKMTYENVNKMLLENDKELINEYQDIYGILLEMNKLAKILQKKRLKRGSFNFEDKEPVFQLNEENDIIDISVRKRYDAEKLIEEFMIVANETVAETISHMDLPFVYRVHSQPTENKIQDLQKVFPLFGVMLKGNEQDFHTLSFINALDELEDDFSKRILSDMIIRSMQKAYYSSHNIGHFGLASTYYTHFTSPIRRYPDLIVHRLLRQYLFEKNYDQLEEKYSRLSYICDHASEREVKAIKAEQQIENQKKTEYMKQFINQEYVGIVASVTDFGFFVELENTIRGLIKYNQLEGYVETKNFSIIMKNRKIIKVGEKIKVRLVAVNIEKGLVDFEPVDYKRENNENYSNKQKGKIRLSDSKDNRSRNRTKRKRNKSNKRWKS